MFDYTICSMPDKDIFKRQCVAIEKHIPGLLKSELLVDVDGSETQEYFKDNKRITVHNSYYIGAVYIVSEIELTHFFE